MISECGKRFFVCFKMQNNVRIGINGFYGCFDAGTIAIPGTAENLCCLYFAPDLIVDFDMFIFCFFMRYSILTTPDYI